jgi:hypothetical protein
LEEVAKLLLWGLALALLRAENGVARKSKAISARPFWASPLSSPAVAFALLLLSLDSLLPKREAAIEWADGRFPAFVGCFSTAKRRTRNEQTDANEALTLLIAEEYTDGGDCDYDQEGDTSHV